MLSIDQYWPNERPNARSVGSGALIWLKSAENAGGFQFSDGDEWADVGVTNPMVLQQIVTPAGPSSGNTVVYAKSGGGLYFLPSGGSEHQLADLDTVQTLSSKTLQNGAVKTTGNNNTEFSHDNVSRMRLWGNTGAGGAGGLSLNKGLTIRNDGVAGNLYDQSNASMLLVQKDVSTDTGYNLVAINYTSQAPTGDNVALSVIQQYNGGGATSVAQGRPLNAELFRDAGVSSQIAVGDKLFEGGLHLASRIPMLMDASGNWTYQYGSGGGASAEAVYTKTGLYLVNDSATHYGSTKVYRTGVAVWVSGADGWDHFDYRADLDTSCIYMLDHRGLLRHYPASFESIWFFDGTTNWTNGTTAAKQTVVTASNTVGLPTGASNYTYVGSGQTFSAVYFDIGTVNVYNVGNATIVAEYYNGSAWAGLSVNQPANGSVLTDNTNTTSGAFTGPFARSGAVTFAPPTDWAKAAPTGSGGDNIGGHDTTPRYWVRFGVQTNVSAVNGLANAVRPGRTNSYEEYAAAGDTVPALAVDAAGSTVVSGLLVLNQSISEIQGAGGATVRSKTTNGNTTFSVTPNGTSTLSQVAVHNNATAASSSVQAILRANSAAVELRGERPLGSGSYPSVKIITGGAQRIEVDQNGDWVHGSAALATNATTGFMWVESCAGTPTGVPAGAYTGRVPLVYDSTNNKIYVYNAAWKATAALT